MNTTALAEITSATLAPPSAPTPTRPVTERLQSLDAYRRLIGLALAVMLLTTRKRVQFGKIFRWPPQFF